MDLPQAMSQEWLRELFDMSIGTRSSHFPIRQSELSARLLLRGNAGQPEMCWLALAFAAYLRGDRGACIRALDAADALAPRDVAVVGHAASLSINLGQPRRAVSYARRLAALSHGDSRHTLDAVNVLYAALHLEEAADLLRGVEREWQPERGELRASQLDAWAASFQAFNVDVESRIALMETAVASIEAAGYAVRCVALNCYPDFSFRCGFFVDQSSSQCANLGFSIAEALTEKFDDAFPELITFGCRPLSSYVPDERLGRTAA